MKKILLIPVALLGMVPLHAQAQDVAAPAASWSVSKTCVAIAPLVPGQTQIQLVSADSGTGPVNVMNVYTDTQLTGPLEGISIQAAPFPAIEGLKGRASKAGDRTFLRVEFGAEWPQFLKDVKAGSELTISAGGETITSGLVGSGLAVTALQRCTR